MSYGQKEKQMLPAQVKELRTSLGYSQSEIARLLGIETSLVSAWEFGLVRVKNVYRRALRAVEVKAAERYMISGFRVRQVREHLGLTPTEFAARITECGSQGAVSSKIVLKLESGEMSCLGHLAHVIISMSQVRRDGTVRGDVIDDHFGPSETDPNAMSN